MYRKIIVGLGVIGTAMCLVWSIHNHLMPNPLKIPKIKQVKLLDLTNGFGRVEFTFPKSVRSTILLGHSNPLSNESLLAGKLILSNRNGSVELLFDKASLTSCNWLEKHSLGGYLLSNPNSGDWNWNDILTSDGTNVLVATNLPAGTSLWLSYTRPSGWDIPFIGKPSKPPLIQQK